MDSQIKKYAYLCSGKQLKSGKMNKCQLLLSSLLVACLLVACGGNRQPQEPASLMEASRQELATALGERDELLAMVKEISSTMDRIKHLENVVSLAPAQSGETRDSRTQIMSDISGIQNTLRQRRERLDELEAKLQQSSTFNEELQATLDALRSMLNAQAAEVAVLHEQLMAANMRIGALNSTVDSLSMAVAVAETEKDSVHESSLKLENELNACYYVIAPKDVLKRHRIIEPGFLRKTRLLNGDFDKGVFIPGDKRRLTAIPLGTDKVKIYSTHPDASYEIRDAGGQKKLYILDPVKFWSVSNYLVIQTD